jgi:DNA-binding HxlR family transcriptional regulator
MGIRRFEDFHKDLGIVRNILSDRLEKLQSSGIMEARRYQERPPRQEYRLTDRGKDLFDVLGALWRWGDRWDPSTTEPMRQLTHLERGKPTHSVPSCAHCGEKLTRADLRIEPWLEVLSRT